ncbi:Peptidyl-prolyl cis-trans isomerase FKBP8 [Schistosoma japonicum]|nr:Peptidyl-prolyl cis-trans isomerase FKBP8 [Schistosoma japonicum]
MGRRKGPKHDHQLKSPNVEHSTEELIAESSVSENLTEAPMTKSPDLEVTACSTETIDVLGNGLVVIKTLRKGLGRETRPSHGDTVVINYKGWLEDGTLVDDVENAKIVLGDGDVIHEGNVQIDSYILGLVALTNPIISLNRLQWDPDIPSGAKLTYHIEILKVDDPPCYANMPNSERLAIANQKKDRGNYYYRREEFAFAIDSYSKALKILQLPTSSTQSSGEKSDVDCPTELINDAKLKLENNLAAAQLKVEAFDAAIMSCDTVLQSDPQNIKALFRKGKALLEMNEVDDAIPILQKVLTLAPGSQMASVELARARAIRQKEREHWSRSVNRRFPKTKQNKNTKLSTLSKVKLVMSSRLMVVTSIVAILSVLIGLFTYIYQPTIMNFNT